MTNEFLTCKYCGRICKNKLSKAKHEHLCKLNPEYEAHMEIHKKTSCAASKSTDVIEKIKRKNLELRKIYLENNPDEQYRDYILTCKKCGEKFIRNIKVRHFKNNYKIPEFCCQEHANSHTHSEEEKKRIGESVKKEHLHICPKCGKDFMNIGTSPNTLCDDCRSKDSYPNKNNVVKTKRRWYKSTELHISNCPCCGKTLWIKTEDDVYCYECCEKLNKHKYQLFDKNGKKILSEKTIQKGREAQLKLVKSGKHKGWQSRNIKSYPEIFWEKVLTNNMIQFKREVPTMRYFLDFVIKVGNLNIDLEIDGKQHKYEDRKHHDKIRDRKLRENGYLVYRIDWNEINSRKGSLKMKYKINQFLWWYDKICCDNRNHFG